MIVAPKQQLTWRVMSSYSIFYVLGETLTGLSETLTGLNLFGSDALQLVGFYLVLRQVDSCRVRQGLRELVGDGRWVDPQERCTCTWRTYRCRSPPS